MNSVALAVPPQAAQSAPITKGPWTKDEDDRLRALVEVHGQQNWSKIAKELGGRVGKQCRERWYNNLSPNIRKDMWTHEEDLRIWRLQRELGNKWVEIARHLEGRTPNAIKNHWNSKLQKYDVVDTEESGPELVLRSAADGPSPPRAKRSSRKRKMVTLERKSQASVGRPDGVGDEVRRRSRSAAVPMDTGDEDLEHDSDQAPAYPRLAGPLAFMPLGMALGAPQAAGVGGPSPYVSNPMSFSSGVAPAHRAAAAADLSARPRTVPVPRRASGRPADGVASAGDDASRFYMPYDERCSFSEPTVSDLDYSWPNDMPFARMAVPHDAHLYIEPTDADINFEASHFDPFVEYANPDWVGGVVHMEE